MERRCKRMTADAVSAAGTDCFAASPIESAVEVPAVEAANPHRLPMELAYPAREAVVDLAAFPDYFEATVVAAAAAFVAVVDDVAAVVAAAAAASAVD